MITAENIAMLDKFKERLKKEVPPSLTDAWMNNFNSILDSGGYDSHLKDMQSAIEKRINNADTIWDTIRELCYLQENIAYAQTMGNLSKALGEYSKLKRIIATNTNTAVLELAKDLQRTLLVDVLKMHPDSITKMVGR